VVRTHAPTRLSGHECRRAKLQESLRKWRVLVGEQETRAAPEHPFRHELVSQCTLARDPSAEVMTEAQASGLYITGTVSMRVVRHSGD